MTATKNNEHKWKGKLCPCQKPARRWHLECPCCDECYRRDNLYHVEVERKDKGIKKDLENDVDNINLNSLDFS